MESIPSLFTTKLGCNTGLFLIPHPLHSHTPSLPHIPKQYWAVRFQQIIKNLFDSFQLVWAVIHSLASSANFENRITLSFFSPLYTVYQG